MKDRHSADVVVEQQAAVRKLKHKCLDEDKNLCGVDH